MRISAFLAAVLGSSSLVACGGGGTGADVLGAGVPPTPEWAVGIGGSGPSAGTALGVLSDGSVIVAGVHDGDVAFARGTPQETVLPGSGATCMFVARHGADGTFRWARCGASVEYLCATGMTVLPDDSFVVGGYAAGRSRLEDGVGGTVDFERRGIEDGLVARYGADGKLLWARTIGGAGACVEVLGVSALKDGSVAVSGLFTGATTLAAGEVNEVTLVPTSLVAEAFVARYRGDGSLMWVRSTTSAVGGYTTAWAVVGQSDLGVVVGGELEVGTVFDRGGPNETSVACAGDDDGWIARFDADGQFEWVRRIGAAEDDEVLSLAVATDGAVLVGGYFRDATLVDPDGPAPIALDGAGGVDAFLATFEADGALRWARSFGGAGDDWGYAVRSLPDGSAILAGGAVVHIESNGAASVVADSTELSDAAFVVRMAPDGVTTWERFAGGDGYDAATAIAVDPVRGNLFVTGVFSGPARFDDGSPDAAPIEVTSVGETDAFLARFALAGAP